MIVGAAHDQIIRLDFQAPPSVLGVTPHARTGIVGATRGAVIRSDDFRSRMWSSCWGHGRCEHIGQSRKEEPEMHEGKITGNGKRRRKTEETAELMLIVS